MRAPPPPETRGRGRYHREDMRTHFTGEVEPTAESLVAALPGLDNFLGVLTSQALAERGGRRARAAGAGG